MNNQMILPEAADTKSLYRAGMQERLIILLRNASRRGAPHASGPFRNSQSRNAMSNTAPPTIKTIHSSGVIGRFTDRQHTPGLCDHSCNKTFTLVRRCKKSSRPRTAIYRNSAHNF